MRKLLFAGCLASIAAATLGVAATSTPRGLVVHEWGTFLAMNGSDGVTLDGMYHEEHALPGFVHARSRDELRLPASNLKGETRHRQELRAPREQRLLFLQGVLRQRLDGVHSMEH